jgi:hypothetical protein
MNEDPLGAVVRRFLHVQAKLLKDFDSFALLDEQSSYF